MAQPHMKDMEAHEQHVVQTINSLPGGVQRQIAELQHTIIIASKAIVEALYKTRY